MEKVSLRVIELMFLAIAGFFLIPAYTSSPEPYGLLPGLAFAGAAFLASLIMAYRRKAENIATIAIKLVGFLVLGAVIYLRCASA